MSEIAVRVLHSATLACAVFATSVVMARRLSRFEHYAVYAVRAGAVLGMAGLVLRTVAAGHLPIFGTLENTWTCAVALLGTAAVTQYRDRRFGRYWRLLVPWAALLGLWGLRSRFAPVPLTISEQSPWVDLHVALAWTAFVALLWAGTIAGLALLRHRKDGGFEQEDETAVARLVMVGYVFLTAMIAAGSWYLFVLFARFWRWEVVGSAALVSWVGYSVVVHGWLMQGWRGTKLFGSVLALVIPLLLLYWIWSVFPGTYHFFDIPLLPSF